MNTRDGIGKFGLTLSLVLSVTCAHALSVVALAHHATCGLSNGSVTTQTWGDACSMVSYLWSNGSTEQHLFNVPPGTYTVMVYDDCGNEDYSTAGVYDIFILGEFSALVSQPACQGECNGTAVFVEPPYWGTAPYTYSLAVMPYGVDQMLVTGFCGGQGAGFTVTDANGCPGYFMIDGLLSAEPSPITVINATPACEGESNGTLSVLLDGPYASQVQVSRSGGGYDQLHSPAVQVPYTITGLPSGEYQLISQMVADTVGSPCQMSYSANVIQQSGPCGSVSGRVFNDADQDCTWDVEEFGLPYRVLTIDPGPSYVVTNAQGLYYSASGNGAFSLTQPLIYEQQLCPDDVPVPFTIDTNTPHVAIDLADSSWMPLDLSVSMWSGEANPGFNAWAIANVTNNSAFPSGDITVTITYDVLLGTLAAIPVPTSSSAGVLTWNIPALGPFAHRQFNLYADVPAWISIGTVIDYSVSVGTASLEPDLTNNSMLLPVMVTGSFDPNDKTARTSSALSTTTYFLDADQWVDYTIRFQNTGTDTAFTVVVRDSLELDLNPETVEILGASHAFWPSFENGRELIFTFANINLPDSGTNEAASHGSIHFRIRPRADIAVGDLISNAVGIYFDFNPPVITNTSELLVEMSTAIDTRHRPELMLVPNPAHDRLEIRAALSGPGLLQIRSTDGRPVRTVNLMGPNTAIDISALPAGAYCADVRDGNGSSVQRLFIKY